MQTGKTPLWLIEFFLYTRRVLSNKETNKNVRRQINEQCNNTNNETNKNLSRFSGHCKRKRTLTRSCFVVWPDKVNTRPPGIPAADISVCQSVSTDLHPHLAGLVRFFSCTHFPPFSEYEQAGLDSAVSFDEFRRKIRIQNGGLN